MVGTTMIDDGQFYVRQGDGGRDGGGLKPYRYLWQGEDGDDDSGYRLERVTSSPGIFEVPVVGDRLLAPNARTLPKELIIIGERGGGAETFQGWLIDQGEQEGAAAGLVPWEVVTPDKALKRLIGEGGALQTRPAVRLIMDSRELNDGPDNSNAALARLAGILESREWGATDHRLVCMTRDVEALKNKDSVFSSILGRGHVYRLPHFDASSELIEWVGELVRKRALRTNKQDRWQIARCIKRWIGGQPTLTHLLFRRVDDRWEKRKASPPKNAEDLKAAFEEEALYLEENPPHLVRRWAQDLHTLLARPEVDRRFTGYAFDEHKGPFDLEDGSGGSCDKVDADLFMAGWVGLDAERVWGMRSECHRRWAKEILRGGMP